MDEDSDVDTKELDTMDNLDNSLLDLHHGLDSSGEDNQIEDNNDEKDTETEKHAYSMNIQGQHVSMLEDMLQEMRQGLQDAVGELARLQGGREDGEREKGMQQQQQRQLDDLTETLDTMKNRMDSMTKTMETIQRENVKLREDFVALEKFVKDNKGEGLSQMTENSLEWTGKFPENPFETENSEENSGGISEHKAGQDEVTAIACKSLSLTQALGEKGLHLNLSMSSSEDGEEAPEMRRVSHYIPSTSSHQKVEEENRRHSLPVSKNQQGMNGDYVADAAQRRKAVKELTDSECDYCSQLWTLVETYCAALQTSGFLSPEQLEVLFPPYLEKLYEQHCVVYSNLQDKLVHWSYLTVVSDLLSCITDTHNPFSLMSLYREYSENLPDAVSCLKNVLAHSAEFKSFLKTIQQSSCQNDDLMTLIKAPAQHLPKYLLQLQQICKYTPSTHPDYLLLRTSLSRLRLFVEQLNIGINNAMQTSRDSRPGSSNDSQLLSARDSGNMSNDDELVSARTMFKSEQCLLSDGFHNDPYENGQVQNITPSSYNRRQLRLTKSQSTNLSTLSHPDLTMINTSPVASSASSSYLPPTGLSWRNAMDGSGGRQINKNKNQMKRMQMQQAQYSLQDPNQHLLRSRPSSAIDFVHGYNSSGHHYPGANYPRPRSAMGPIDSHHRPTIISRKHMRKSQPPLSTSGYWGDMNTQHPKQLPQKMVFSPAELLPSRPSPLLPYASQEEDEEDDTRASDSFSHLHSSGRGSHNSNDIDIEFQPLASDPIPSFHSNGNDHSNQFLEDDMALRLAQEMLSDDDDQYKMVNGNGAQGRKYVDDRKLRAEERNIDNGHIKKPESQESRTYREENKIRDSRHSMNNLQSARTRLGNNSINSQSQDQSFDKLESKERGTEENFKHNREQILSGSHVRDDDSEEKRKENQNFLLSLSHSPRSRKVSDSALKTSKISQQEIVPNKQSKQPYKENSSSSENINTVKPVATQKTTLLLKSQQNVVRRSAPNLISRQENGGFQGNQSRFATSNMIKSNDVEIHEGDDTSVKSASNKHLINGTHLSATKSYKKSSDSHAEEDDDDAAGSKSLMTRSLDLTEVLNSEGSVDKIQDRRKKLKNGGVDSLPKASDDPVNARKKMHLKSSIKNLFSKKRLNESDV